MSAARFWEWFSAAEEALFSGTCGAAEKIQQRLREYQARMGVEVSTEVDGKRELTFSAGGDKALFPRVDALVAAAPPLQRWVLFALTPPRGFQFVMEHQGHRLVANGLTFQAAPLQGAGGPIQLRVLVEQGTVDEGLVEGVVQLLALGLGERQTALRVAGVEVLPASEAQGDRIPLFALPGYLAWLDSRSGG